MSRKSRVGTVVNLRLAEGLVTVVFPDGLSVEQTFGLTGDLQRCREFLTAAAVVKSWEKKTHQTARVQTPPAKSILRRAA